MAFNFFNSKQAQAEIVLPTLELSGVAIAHGLKLLWSNCEKSGGIETYVEALKLKQIAFKDIFSRSKIEMLEAREFAKISKFMPTIRRRIGPYVETEAFMHLKTALIGLVSPEHDANKVDERIIAFCANFPDDKHHRWVRDLAAEVLHNTYPELYPLMTRWMWDLKANTGVIREIWHGDIDKVMITVPDNYATFLQLRAELSEYLHKEGVYKDTIQYVDLLCTQIYADYVAAQGGSYLRADFSSAEDGIGYLLRLLGLDGVKAKVANDQIPPDNAGLLQNFNKG